MLFTVKTASQNRKHNGIALLSSCRAFRSSVVKLVQLSESNITSELSREMTSEDCFCNLKIVNLSSKELTEGQIKLLSKGLKFTPTPKKDV